MICYSESGHVALVNPNRREFEIMSSSRIKKSSGEHWAHPDVKNGRLFIRHGRTLLVYNSAK